jgi:predicted DNA-binding ribbon-helix-helix protein
MGMAVITKLGRSLIQYNRTLCLRSYGSALYMTGDEAKDIFSVVSPHIDIEARFKEISALKRSVELRGMQVDVDRLKIFWEVLKSVEADKITIENKRVDIAKRIKQLKKENSDATKETEKLKFPYQDYPN